MSHTDDLLREAMDSRNTDTWFWTMLFCSCIAALADSPAWPVLIAATGIVGAIGAATKTIIAARRQESAR